MPRPSVGRIVHYRSYGTPGGEYASVCRAAIVTEVDTTPLTAHAPFQTVGLCVLNPEGLFLNRHVEHVEPTYGQPPPGGTWHWPERVEEI